jgi:hypothetical protein
MDYPEVVETSTSCQWLLSMAIVVNCQAEVECGGQGASLTELSKHSYNPPLLSIVIIEK